MLDEKDIQEMLLNWAARDEQKSIEKRKAGDDAAANVHQERAQAYLEDAILCDQK